MKEFYIMSRRNLKVLLVSPLPPPTGGIASWTIHVLDYFKTNETEVNLCHYNTGGGNRRITDIGLFKRIYYGIIDLRTRISEVCDQVEDGKLDIVHITSSASLGLLRDWLMLRKLKKTKAKLIVHFRFGRIPQLSHKKNWEWKMLRQVCKLANEVIVLDNCSYETLIKNGFSNVSYLPNPISKSLEDKVRSGVIGSREQGTVLFVGHIIPFKGVFELVDACCQLDKVNKLTFIGPYEQEIKEQLLSLSLKKDKTEWITFEGVQNHDFIIDKMKKCSAFLLPSYTEGFPNVILEAMAARAPIVATSVGAIPEILKCQNGNKIGYCVAPRDIEELKLSLNTILDNPIDATRMGELAQNKVFSEYSMNVVMNSLINIWKK